MHFDNTFVASAKFRYGFLAILLALLACDLWELPGQLHSGSAIPCRAVFLSLGLLFNHLAFFACRTEQLAEWRGFSQSRGYLSYWCTGSPLCCDDTARA